MQKWKIESVYPPDMVNENYPEIKREAENKYQKLLEEGYEPFAVIFDKIWFRLKLD